MPRLAALTLSLTTLTAAAAAPDDGLETVSVSATAVTYAAPPTQTLLTSGQSLLELPRSLTVLSADYLRDRAPLSLGEALRGVPGVGITQGEGHRDALVLRGVATTSDLLLDGLRDDVQYLRDLYAVQQIEVLTGANAVLVGHSGGGGSVNRVTKQAGGRQREYVLQGSSQNGLRMTADLGDDATNHGSARVNLLWEDSGSFRDDVRLNRKGVAPVLRFEPAPALALSGGGEFFADARTVDRGVPSLNGRPLDTPVGRYYGDPNRSRSDITALSAWSLLEWSGPAGLTLRNRSRWADYDKSYANVYARGVDPVAAKVLISAYSQTTRRTALLNRTDLRWQSAGAGLTHNLVVGLEWGAQDNDNQRLTGYFTDRSPSVTTVQVPLSSGRTSETVARRPSTTDPDNHSELRYTGLFAQDSITIRPYLQMQLGLRAERTGMRLRDNRNAAQVSHQEMLWSPQTALIVRPAAHWSVYATYGTTSQTRAGEQLVSLTSASAGLTPEQMATHEAGVKWSPDSATLLTAALYRLQRRNVAVTDPADATRQVLVEGQQVDGVEFGAAAAAGQWSVQANLSVQRAQLMADQGPALRRGARLAGVPGISGSLWLRRQLTPSWAASLGVQHRGALLAATENRLAPDANVWLPASTRLDTALYWSGSNLWRVQLNLENLLDSRSFLSATNNYNILPAAPRTLRARISLDL